LNLALDAIGAPQQKGRTHVTTSTRIRFTPSAVSRLKPGEQPYVAWDTSHPGFGVRVGISGKKTWIVQFKTNDQQRRRTVGVVRNMSLAAARAKAAALVANFDESTDDNEAGNSRTFNDLLAEYETYLTEVRRLRSARERIRELRRGFGDQWGNTAIRAITKKMAIERLDTIQAEKTEARARALQSQCRTFFKWAGERDYIDTNIFDTVPQRGKYPKRTRYLTMDEIGFVWTALNVMASQLPADLYRLAILTGQRRGEIGGMQPQELNLRDRVWSLPAARVKNKRAHKLPISKTVLVIVQNRINPDALFIMSMNGEKPYNGWSNCGHAVRRAVDELWRVYCEHTPEDQRIPAIRHWTYHDLRRSVATNLAEHLNLSIAQVERHLNHISGEFGGIVQNYNLAAFFEERRKAMEAWDALVLKSAKRFEPLLEHL